MKILKYVSEFFYGNQSDNNNRPEISLVELSKKEMISFGANTFACVLEFIITHFLDNGNKIIKLINCLTALIILIIIYISDFQRGKKYKIQKDDEMSEINWLNAVNTTKMMRRLFVSFICLVLFFIGVEFTVNKYDILIFSMFMYNIDRFFENLFFVVLEYNSNDESEYE